MYNASAPCCKVLSVQGLLFLPVYFVKFRTAKFSKIESPFVKAAACTFCLVGIPWSRCQCLYASNVCHFTTKIN